MKTKILTLILSLFALAFIGCKKNAEKQAEQPLVSHPNTVAAAAATSFENPFDYIGAQHNEALQAGWDNLQQNGDTTKAGKRAFMVQYFKDHYGRDLNKTIDACAPMEKLGIDEILNKSPLSATCNDLLRAIMDSGKLLKDESSLEAYQQAIQRIEVDSQSSGLAQSESDAVLQVAAIAKYSSKYWLEKVTRFDPPGPQGKWYSWFISLTADTAGAILGVFTGDIEGEASYNSELMTYYVH